jgi:hypothetical protein
MTFGPASALLEQELAQEIRRQGIVVWLDRDKSFTTFVDRLAERHAAGTFEHPVVGFRGSYLEMLFALETRGSGYDRNPLLIHMPGFNEEGMRTTPVLELYSAGTRFRKALDTLIRQAATGRVAPAEVDRFLADKPTLEQADAWLDAASAAPSMGLLALLEASGPTLVIEALSGPDSTVARQAKSDVEVLRGYLHKLTGMDDEFCDFLSKEGKSGVEGVLMALGAWLLCVEYVHDLRRSPKLLALQRLKGVPGELVKVSCKLVSVRARGKKSLFFCQSRSLSESVAERMRGRGAEVFVHHSSVSRDERREAEARFHHGTDAAIVCTSTLELGIDVGDLDLVFQANAPSTVSSFMQRMGRTGRRAGQVANTTFLCESPEDVLQAVAIVELARKGWVESVPVQDRCWPVLVHQILAQTLQFGAISAERCFEQLARVPDFRGITPAERAGLVEHLIKEEYLFESGGLLSMGTKAERIFGRKNFSELYAVFSSPVLYRVETETGRDLGSLDQDFADRLVEEMSSFLLGGRAWTVVRLDHKERTVVVREAPRGQKPSWGGFLPQLLGFEICQEVRQIIVDMVE